MNTFAMNGTSPLSFRQTKSEILKTILFTDKVIIPAPSILCNPATEQWMRSNPGFINYLFESNKIATVLDEKHRTFKNLSNWLQDRDSASLRWIKRNNLREISDLLDEMICSSHDNFECLNLEDLSKRKTQLSLSFVDNLEKAIPGIGIFKEKIIEYAKIELDTKGTLHGTWWNNLGKTTDKRLSVFDNYLSEIGTMVFDFSYGTCVGGIVAGHSYGFIPSKLIEVSKQFLPRRKVEIEFQDMDERLIDSSILNPLVLSSLNMEQFKALENETKEKKQNYLKAVSNLNLETTEDRLKETKARLDEYIIELSQTKKFLINKEFIQNENATQKSDSILKIYRSAETVLISICVGATACGFAKQFSGVGSELGLMIAFFASSAAYPLKKYLGQKTKYAETKASQLHDNLDYIRPVSISLNLNIENED